jgi:hypothetical protein
LSRIVENGNIQRLGDGSFPHVFSDVAALRSLREMSVLVSPHVAAERNVSVRGLKRDGPMLHLARQPT